MSHILVLAETWNYNELISDRKNSGNTRGNCKRNPYKTNRTRPASRVLKAAVHRTWLDPNRKEVSE
jgi:hypothetical protein